LQVFVAGAPAELAIHSDVITDPAVAAIADLSQKD
jgi:hypothetical protein